jgi:glycosyltransferase involved in cell wall biosynthesis
MSEHEGFAAPLVEAMACGLPVVARDAGAVSETVGGAGLLVPYAAPLLAAELVERLLVDEPLRTALIVRGRRRAEALVASAALERLLDVLWPAVPQLTTR